MPKIKMGLLVKILAVLVLLVVVGFVVLSVKGRTVVKSGDKVKPSDGQIEVIKEFGYPDTFLLSMDNEDRFEVWGYHSLGKQFSFLNGDFVEMAIVDKLDVDEYEYTDFRPTQFYYGQSEGDVKKILGDYTAKGVSNLEFGKGANIYDYWDQVKVAVKDGQLVFVETLPIYNPAQFRPNEK